MTRLAGFSWASQHSTIRSSRSSSKSEALRGQSGKPEHSNLQASLLSRRRRETILTIRKKMPASSRSNTIAIRLHTQTLAACSRLQRLPKRPPRWAGARRKRSPIWIKALSKRRKDSHQSSFYQLQSKWKKTNRATTKSSRKKKTG